MSKNKITAINVFIDIDGKHCIAPISADSADMFLAMLPAYQGGGNEVRLISLPEDVVQDLQKTRDAIGKRMKG